MLSKIINKLIKAFVNITVYILENWFKNGENRYYVLEEIARIPYFSYVTCNQFLQWLELKPAIEVSKLHFKQTINETWHLEIMQELGGDKNFIDVVIAKIIGLFYYWLNIIIFLFFPKNAYYLMQSVENHAVKSYTHYIKKNQEYLSQTFAKPIATKYYFTVEDHMNLKLDLNNDKKKYKPTLLDIYNLILEDEKSHVKELTDLINN